MGNNNNKKKTSLQIKNMNQAIKDQFNKLSRFEKVLFRKILRKFEDEEQSATNTKNENIITLLELLVRSGYLHVKCLPNSCDTECIFTMEIE